MSAPVAKASTCCGKSAECICAPSISALSGPTISANVVGLGGAGIVSGWIRDGMVAGRDDDIHWTGQTIRDNVSRRYTTAIISPPVIDHALVVGEADEELLEGSELGSLIPVLSTPSTFLRLGIPTLSARYPLFLGFLTAPCGWPAKTPFIILGDLWINVYASVNYDPLRTEVSPMPSPTGGLTKFQILFWNWTKWLRCDAMPWLVSVWEDLRGILVQGTLFFSRNTKKKRKKWRIPGPTLQGIVADTKSQLEREEEEKELERRRKEQETAADNGNGASRRKGGRGNGGRKQRKW
ncbi:hypothetical protein B0T13DRAFT_492286 [Neurospora crassa]|nr:hypothetical protein B0T13DRAFT_492286 [Neurospora crassa]